MECLSPKITLLLGLYSGFEDTHTASKVYPPSQWLLFIVFLSFTIFFKTVLCEDLP